MGNGSGVSRGDRSRNARLGRRAGRGEGLGRGDRGVRAGHRWPVLAQLAADRSMPFVCVQPMVTSWSQRTEDLTWDKTDEKDAVLIARLTAQLRCYILEPVDETWRRLLEILVCFLHPLPLS